MPNTPHVLTALAIAAGLLAAGPASAASLVVVRGDSLERVDAAGAPAPKRPWLQRDGVNLDDCRLEQRIRFTLVATDLAPNGAIEAWASYDGASCVEQTARAGASATCWRVASGIPLQQQTQVDVPVRTIVSGALDPQNPRTDASVCGTLDESRLAVHFLYFEPGQPATAATTYSVAIPVDMVAGPTPTGLVATSEPGRVRVSWAPRNRANERVEVHCAPVSHVAPTAEPGTCAPLFTPRSSPDEIMYVVSPPCGVVGGALDPTATVESSSWGRLEPGVDHVFSVLAVDAFGNASDPSASVCAAAHPREGDGVEGVGCAVSRGGAGDVGLLGAAAVLALVAVRRRRCA